MKWLCLGKKIETRLRDLMNTEDEGDKERDGYFLPGSDHVVVGTHLEGTHLVQRELHEQLHALVERMSLSEAGLSDELEEIVVNGVSTWILENKKNLAKRFDQLAPQKRRLPRKKRPASIA